MSNANSGGPGSKPFRNSAVTNSALAVKGSSGRLHGWHAYNSNGGVVFLQLYDLAAASVVVGTTVPVITLVVFANGGLDDPTLDPPIEFSNAIAVACTTTPDGNLGPAAAILVDLFWR